MPLRFTLRHLEYLVAVGECGSIALASERVNVSSPSISAAISQLEAEFGLPLFVRKHAHGLSLTQGGRQFMEQARIVLAQAAKLNDLANDITGKVRGPLNVGCLLTFAQIIVPQLRRSFSQHFPDVDFRQFECNQAEIFEGIRAAKLDVALSADYFLSFFTSLGLRPKIAERTRDMAVMRSLVANGFGYSIANIRPLSDVAPDGRRLRFVPLTGPVRSMRMGLVLAEGASASLTVRSFVDHCRAVITPENAPGLHLRLPGPVRDF